MMNFGIDALVHRFPVISINKYINNNINVRMPRISHRPKLSFTQKELDYLQYFTNLIIKSSIPITILNI